MWALTAWSPREGCSTLLLGGNKVLHFRFSQDKKWASTLFTKVAAAFIMTQRHGLHPMLSLGGQTVSCLHNTSIAYVPNCCPVLDSGVLDDPQVREKARPWSPAGCRPPPSQLPLLFMSPIILSSPSCSSIVKLHCDNEWAQTT